MARQYKEQNVERKVSRDTKCVVYKPIGRLEENFTRRKKSQSIANAIVFVKKKKARALDSLLSTLGKIFAKNATKHSHSVSATSFLYH